MLQHHLGLAPILVRPPVPVAQMRQWQRRRQRAARSSLFAIPPGIPRLCRGVMELPRYQDDL